jgi:adenylosuccinate synthase
MITLVVGAQYGGEGKGKVSAYLATREHFFASCRSGGENSSHTICFGERMIHLRMLPAAALVDQYTQVVYGAGSLLHVPTLLEEMSTHRVWPRRIMIDPQAGIISDELVREQRKDTRYKHIGSTLTGTGYATAERAKRRLLLARDCHEIQDMVTGDIIELLTDADTRGQAILLEGHQAFGLSNYHGDYPYVSSRDCTASEMLSEVGLGIRTNRMHVVLVVKAFPTRNHNGTLPHEMNSADASTLGIKEKGGGAWDRPNKRRRVAHIDLAIIKRAALANGATAIALTSVDHLDSTMAGTRSIDSISHAVYQFIAKVEQATGIWVRYLSTGPGVLEMIDRGAP